MVVHPRGQHSVLRVQLSAVPYRGTRDARSAGEAGDRVVVNPQAAGDTAAARGAPGVQCTRARQHVLHRNPIPIHSPFLPQKLLDIIYRQFYYAQKIDSKSGIG